MKLNIAYMLGIVDAELELEAGKVYAITGGNASGKSSFAISAGAVLARNDNPLGAASTQRKLYMHDGASAGEVTLRDADGSVRWFMPSGDLQQAPGVVYSSTAAVGLEDFIAPRSAAALSSLWEGLFLPSGEAIEAQLRKRLAPVVDAVSIDRIVAQIKEAEDDPTVSSDHGWSLAQQTYADRARQAKQQWTRIAGETWGVKKGADWLPERWLAEYDGVTDADAQRSLDEAEQALQSAHVAHAVDASVVEQAQEAAARLPAVREALRVATLEAERLEEAAQAEATLNRQLLDAEAAALRLLKLAEGELRDLREGTKQGLECPGCHAPLVLVDGKLEHKPDNSTLIAEAEQNKAECEETYRVRKKATAKLGVESRYAHRTARDAMQQAQANLHAVEREARNAQATVRTAEMVEALDDAKRDCDRMRGRLECIADRARAQELHTNIVQYDMVAKLLAPNGVRADVMAGALKQVNDVLDKLASRVGWPTVEVGSKYGISIDKRRLLRMCSFSERLRAQYLLQIAIARCRKDPVVILDQVDTLEESGQSQLLELVSFLSVRKPDTAFILCGTRLGPKWAKYAQLHDIEDGRMGQVLAA